MPHRSRASDLTPPVGPRDHVRGHDNAVITLVEFGDYECPHCGRAYPVIRAIQDELGDRLRFAFRNFPLERLHPHARLAAESAEAAAAQGKFWEMHGAIFTHQRALDRASLLAYASRIGLDVDR